MSNRARKILWPQWATWALLQAVFPGAASGSTSGGVSKPSAGAGRMIADLAIRPGLARRQSRHDIRVNVL